MKKDSLRIFLLPDKTIKDKNKLSILLDKIHNTVVVNQHLTVNNFNLFQELTAFEINDTQNAYNAFEKAVLLYHLYFNDNSFPIAQWHSHLSLEHSHIEFILEKTNNNKKLHFYFDYIFSILNKQEHCHYKEILLIKNFIQFLYQPNTPLDTIIDNIKNKQKYKQQFLSNKLNTNTYQYENYIYLFFIFAYYYNNQHTIKFFQNKIKNKEFFTFLLQAQQKFFENPKNSIFLKQLLSLNNDYTFNTSNAQTILNNTNTSIIMSNYEENNILNNIKTHNQQKCEITKNFYILSLKYLSNNNLQKHHVFQSIEKQLIDDETQKQSNKVNINKI